MIKKEGVEHIAHLAKLELTEEQKELYSKQLSNVMDYVEQLSKVDTKGVKPLLTPSDIEKHYREDIVEKNFPVEEKLQNAPDKVGNLIKVPPVVG